MLRVRIGGLVFESWPSNYDRCFLITPEGWTGWDDGVEVRRDSAERPVSHGAFDSPGYLGSRVVSITGTILASSTGELAHMVQQLKGVLADGGVGRLEVDDDSGTRWCDVRLGAQPRVAVATGGLEAEFQIQFWAPDPRTYGRTKTFTGGASQVLHYGNFPAVPEVTVVGPVTGPYTVASQGRSFTVTQSLTSGQSHRIDMSTGWVYRNGVLQTGVVSSGQKFTVPPGQRVAVTGPASMTVSVVDTFI